MLTAHVGDGSAHRPGMSLSCITNTRRSWFTNSVSDWHLCVWSTLTSSPSGCFPLLVWRSLPGSAVVATQDNMKLAIVTENSSRGQKLSCCVLMNGKCHWARWAVSGGLEPVFPPLQAPQEEDGVSSSSLVTRWPRAPPPDINPIPLSHINIMR